jgi:hypothetical protein
MIGFNLFEPDQKEDNSPKKEKEFVLSNFMIQKLKLNVTFQYI